MTLASSRNPKLQATPQSRELAVNSAMQIMKKRLRPNMPTNQPLIGSTMALETRYDVNTQVLSSLLAPKSPAMCGSATLAMLVSSTSMKAARATTIATSQGLNFGVQISVGAAMVSLLDVHFRIYRQTRPQTMIAVFARIEIYANWYPLH